MNFYQCKECGQITVTDAPLEKLGEHKVELIPNTTDAAGEKHVPVIQVEGSKVTVCVGAVEHPMLEAHYITFIVLETSQGYQKKNLKPGEKPMAVFALAEGEKVVAAYEFCNLHGLWKAEA
jgi:superoxide reductase